MDAPACGILQAGACAMWTTRQVRTRGLDAAGSCLGEGGFVACHSLDCGCRAVVFAWNAEFLPSSLSNLLNGHSFLGFFATCNP